MKKSKQHTALYQFLTPWFESGADSETLTNARREYKKAYKAKWQREHRKINKRYTISINKADNRIIETAASKHRRSPAMFIKHASLAYCRKQYLSLNQQAINTIKEQLIMNYCMLQQISEDQGFDSIEVLARFEILEKKIIDLITNPKEINQQ